MKNSILFSFILLLSIATVCAQKAKTEQKLGNLINALEETKFIKDYKTYRSDIENIVLELNQAQIDPKEMTKVKMAYKQSKSNFDGLLDQLKRDLANNATRKLILKSPETFSRNYQKKLDTAKVYCNDNFRKKAASLLPQNDALVAESLELLFGTFFSIIKTIGEKKSADNEFTALYLETNLIEPLRFKAWEKIE
jgi:hypothetical protein